MKLDWLKLVNFKGSKALKVVLQGEDLNVYGDNGTGKTTLADALAWLLTGLDSNGKALGQDVKTLADDGEAHHNLEHVVEAVLCSDDGKKINLRKVLAEKWTKKRGNATPEFTGHTVDHFIDGVPVKESFYKAAINDLCGADQIVKILLNPVHFAERLSWQDRRRVLLDLCGDLTDDMVISSRPDLAELPAILTGHTVDEHKKVLVHGRKKINDELQTIPVRIAEVQLGMSSTAGLVEDTIREAIVEANSSIKAKEQERAQMQAGGGSSNKREELAKLNAEITELESSLKDAHADVVREKRAAVDTIETQVAHLRHDVSSRESALQAHQDTIAAMDTQLASLRAEYYAVQQNWPTSVDDHCPTCGQSLPPERIAETQAKANNEKANRLAEINKHGLAAKQGMEKATADMGVTMEAIADLTFAIEQGVKELDSAKQELQEVIEQDIFAKSGTHKSLVYRRDKAAAELTKLAAGGQTDTSTITLEIDRLRSRRDEAQEKLNTILANRRAEERIAELATREKELAAEFGHCERHLSLIEQFIRAKVSMLEGSVNAKFKLVRWKLFAEQVNGGLAECCEATVNGVPYSAGLNTGSRINAGIDIINTLADHYGQTMPLFVDNCESVTQLIPSAAQVIRLMVSEPDKSLRFEINHNTQEMQEAS